MNQIRIFCLFTWPAMVAAVAGEPLAASAPAQDKWQYNLFNPTPRHLMRPMSTDRPDKTESPHTVDAGHFQIESSLAELAFDNWNDDGERVFGLNAANINLKAGLLNNTDFQVILENYLYEETDAGGTTTEKSGFGDITTRLKVNLWGNDGGPTALAVMPLVKWPVNTGDLGNKKIEGGVIVPFGMELPWGFGMGAMTEVDFVHRDGGNYGANFVNSITFSRSIVGELAGYAECFTELQDTGRDPVVTLDTGLTFMLTENVQLDAGINFGVTRAADDFNPFAGISMRF